MKVSDKKKRIKHNATRYTGRSGKDWRKNKGGKTLRYSAMFKETFMVRTSAFNKLDTLDAPPFGDTPYQVLDSALVEPSVTPKRTGVTELMQAAAFCLGSIERMSQGLGQTLAIRLL